MSEYLRFTCHPNTLETTDCFAISTFSISPSNTLPAQLFPIAVQLVQINILNRSWHADLPRLSHGSSLPTLGFWASHCVSSWTSTKPTRVCTVSDIQSEFTF